MNTISVHSSQETLSDVMRLKKNTKIYFQLSRKVPLSFHTGVGVVTFWVNLSSGVDARELFFPEVDSQLELRVLLVADWLAIRHLLLVV